ncbi:MAG: hypothetical protein JXR83_10590 [Deltaproteobacteria bacterium]|nr:hypothetical protein [Deltaproteobacteria bacterium]
MKRLAVAVMTVGLVFVFACVQKATKEECQAACKKQAELQNAAKPKSPGDDPVLAVTNKYQPQIAEAEKAKADAMAAIDKEFEAKLAKAKSEKDKAKVNDEITKKKDEKSKELQPKIDELNKSMADERKTAVEAKAKKDADAKAAAEKALTACVDACVNAGTAKTKAECQAKAANLEAYGKCQ